MTGPGGKGMRRKIVVLALPVLVGGLIVAAGCASLATPEAPSTTSPSPGATAAVAVSQQVKDGAQLYVDFACIRCHAPDGVGGVPNRLNVGGDDTIPPLNNVYRDPSEKFANAAQIATVLNGVTKNGQPTAMVPWRNTLSDIDIAAVITYTRNSWGNHTGEAIQPSEVKVARQ